MTDHLNPPTSFATARLRLRKPEMTDSGALFRAYCADKEVVRYLTWMAHESEVDTRNFLGICESWWAEKSKFPFVIERDTGPIGMIDLHNKDTAVGFGYVLAKPHWGQGFMSEALSVLVDWSLAQTGIWRAYAFCDLKNKGSARVMEKAGMSFEGILRRYFVHPNLSDEPRDCRLYAKVRD